MYLMIMEDGVMVQLNKASKEDYESVEDGVLEVIRFRNGKFEIWVDKERQWEEVQKDI